MFVSLGYNEIVKILLNFTLHSHFPFTITHLRTDRHPSETCVFSKAVTLPKNTIALNRLPVPDTVQPKLNCQSLC